MSGITRSYPRDLAGQPTPVEIIDQPLVIDGTDCFLGYVGEGVMLTFSMDSIRAWAQEGMPMTVRSAA